MVCWLSLYMIVIVHRLVPVGCWSIVCLHGLVKDNSKDMLVWMCLFALWQLVSIKKKDVVIVSLIVISFVFTVCKIPTLHCLLE